MQYTIDQALNVNLFKYIVVSTDSKKIYNLSNKLGVESWFLRHKKFSYGKDFAQVAHIHDEMQLSVKEGLEDDVGKAAIEAIKDTQKDFNFRCELTGEYKIGRTWAETH